MSHIGLVAVMAVKPVEKKKKGTGLYFVHKSTNAAAVKLSTN